MFKKFIKNQNLIFLLLALGLQDYLTLLSWGTFIVLSLLSFFINKKIPYLTNSLVIIYAGLFFKGSGFILTPETAFNLLWGLVFIKRLESTYDHSYRVRFFGEILLLISSLLFNKTLTFYLVVMVGLFISIQVLSNYLQTKMRFEIKKILLLFLKIIPLAAILFFLFPRTQGFIPLPNISPVQNKGEVGFNPDVNLSDIAELKGTGEIAFRAQIDKKMKQSLLYWRGQTLSQNDGWNWSRAYFDKTQLNWGLLEKKESNLFKQNIWLSKPSSRLFILDFPHEIHFQNKTAPLKNMPSFEMFQTQGVSTYQAYSSSSLPNDFTHQIITSLPSKKVKEVINDWPSDPEKLLQMIRSYYQKNSFYYSLTPGKSINLEEFLFKNKKGFCGHFSSATALILNAKGIPTRLVSGFLGGTFNESGNFYTILSDEAHVWIEYWHHAAWHRVDPTMWVFPERLNLTGPEVLMINAKERDQKKFFQYKFIIQSFQKIDELNFKFMVYMEELTQAKQLDLFSPFGLKIKDLFMMFCVFIATFALLIYFNQFFKFKKNSQKDSLSGLWIKLNLCFPSFKGRAKNLKQWQDFAQDLPSPRKEWVKDVLKSFEESFKKKSAINEKEIKWLLLKIRWFNNFKFRLNRRL